MRIVCEAFDLAGGGYARCGNCGQPYWVHSHEYVPAVGRMGRIRHRLITQGQAADKYLAHFRAGGSSSIIVPDFRPRYHIMQERRVSISKFYLTAAQLQRHQP